MKWNDHWKLKDKHAVLSASNNAWLRYDEEKLSRLLDSIAAKHRGTEYHKFAEMAIRNRIKLPRTKKTLDSYVNDAIGYRMDPEVILYYSEYCFGTVDAISFDKNILRIHDLKTGEGAVKFDQLLIYAALFCLEYSIDPNKITLIELRIYQMDDIKVYQPEPIEIGEIMNKIVISNEIIKQPVK